MVVEHDRGLPRAATHPLAILIVVFALLATLWWVFLGEERRTHREVEIAASAEASNLAHAFEEHVARTVRDIDAALLLLSHSWRHRPDYFREEVAILQKAYDRGLLVQVAVIDADGRLAYSSLSTQTLGADLSDREHFRIHRDPAHEGLFISKPVVGRVSGTVSIQFTRRITEPNGDFGGVVVVSLDPRYFSRFFGAVDVGGEGVIALVGLDGVIRARSSAAADPSQGIGATVPPACPFLGRDAPAAGIYAPTSAVDGVSRLVAFRRVEGIPLVVTVGLAVGEIFRSHNEVWSYYRRWAGVLSVLLMLGGFTLTHAIATQRRYRVRLAAQAIELATANEDLGRQQERLSNVNDSLRLLNSIATMSQASTKEKLTEALRLGCRHLGLEGGVIAEVSGQQYRVAHSWAQSGTLQDGDVLALGDTVCALTLAADDVVAIHHVGASAHAGHPAHKANALECYIGVPLMVQGRPYGTLSFSSPRPCLREFDDGDLEFMRLLSQWAGFVLGEGCARAQLRKLATTDPLTGTWNRRQFLDTAARDVALAQRHGHPLSMMMLDIDHFKRVNDSHGHQAGDQTLVAVADACRRTLRASDAFARLGGEEFAALLLETGVDGAAEMGERLRAAVAALSIPTARAEVHVTISVGVAELRNGEDVEALLNRADMALYRAKEDGRDRVLSA